MVAVSALVDIAKNAIADRAAMLTPLRLADRGPADAHDARIFLPPITFLFAHFSIFVPFPFGKVRLSPASGPTQGPGTD